MKKIIACSDGTGNTAIKDRGTNVFKLFEAIDVTGHETNPSVIPQVAFYDDGVGTENFKPLKILGGACGWGLSRNVKHLYKQIVRVYDPGDELYLFGFSRGAFTVRTLGGFISRCGLLDRNKLFSAADLDDAVDKAYSLYRDSYRTSLMRLLLGPPDTSKTAQFRKDNCHPEDANIKFIGVWDTVDSVGLPFHVADVINQSVYRFKFPDHQLNHITERACHALSIDDQRAAFEPVLWDEWMPQVPNGSQPADHTWRGQAKSIIQSRIADSLLPATWSLKKESKPDERIEQVWFSGVHANVGGGYPKQGLSLVTLDWMMSKAEESGLRFIAADRHSYRAHANFDDKLYDNRSGLGSFYEWKIRDIAELCKDRHIGLPKIHLSVFERIAHGPDGYAPGNLPEKVKVVATDNSAQGYLEARVDAVQKTLQKLLDMAILKSVTSICAMGRFSYYLYLGSVLLLILSLATGGKLDVFHWSIFKKIASVASTAISSPSQLWGALKTAFIANPSLMYAIAFGLFLALLLARSTDWWLDRKFSGFWHPVQNDLRNALKQNRQIHLSRQPLTPPNQNKPVVAPLPPKP